MSGATSAFKETKSVCPYCGVGCGLVVSSEGSRVTSVAGDPTYPVNRGRTCAKPLALPDAVGSRDRARVPLRRDSRDSRWRERGWEETTAELATRLSAIRERHGPDSIAFYVSGQLLTEDYYVVNKLAKGFMGTNNVDSNSRLCMSSAVAGYTQALGSDGPPPCYDDIPKARCFFLLGTNTAACHPILWAQIRNRMEEGATVVVADPRRSETARHASLHLPVLPGTDLALLNAMLWVIDREGLVDRGFVERHTEGFEEMMRVAGNWPPARAAQVCGVKAADIAEAARRFATADGSMALWSMGANQSRVGTLKNRALINLCLVTGQIGRPGAGPLSLTGQPNAMGGREVGGLAHLLPGYRSVSSAEDRAEMRTLWDLPPGAAGISPKPGLTAVELIEGLERGDVRAVWIIATNPAVSLPDAGRAREAFARAELVVCQDAYHPTETSALADFVLPAAAWPEKEGTMTNSERRIGLVRKAADPPGEALPDWRIIARLARGMGWGDHFAWESSAAVYDEFAKCTAGRLCDQSGVSHARLRREGSLQWPCPAEPDGEHPGTARLYADRKFPREGSRAALAPTPHLGPAETPSGDFPILLTTGRVANQWHTMTRTGKSERLLEGAREPFVEISQADAQSAGILEGQPVIVSSARGSARLVARVVDTLARGVAFAPFHWGALHAPPGAGTVNDVTNPALDPDSLQPELKACAVRIEALRPSAASAAPVSGACSRASEAKRLVVVGTGMAGLSTVEAVFERSDPARWKVTMIGREPQLPYNRINLSRLIASGGRDGIELRPKLWYESHGVEVLSSTETSLVDTESRQVALANGERLDYDRLVLATGSMPSSPPIPGLGREGVVAFRTVDDAHEIVARARGARRAAVIGGGLLGLEAARGLVELGLEVTVVHLVDRLMETQLDDSAARLLARCVRQLGAEVMLGRSTSEVTGNGRVEGLRFADGEELEADLVVVATGIRPDVELARRSGLEIERGIVVDDEMRASAPSVWAVGECAEHRGTVYGIWAPLLDQARAAGATIASDPGAFTGRLPATTLKVAGIDLFTAGSPFATDDDADEIVAADGRTGTYRKLVVRGGHLVGAILLGDLALAPLLGDVARTGRPVPTDVLDAVTAAGEMPRHEGADDSLVCTCNAVSRGKIKSIARDRRLTTVEEIGEATRATTGCGSCAPDVRAILTELDEERAEDLRYARLTRR